MSFSLPRDGRATLVLCLPILTAFFNVPATKRGGSFIHARRYTASWSGRLLGVA
jgi:hypothetical protein